MLCCGNEFVVNYCQGKLHAISTLSLFQHIDQDGMDQGAKVRSKARDIVDLLNDKDALTEARRTKSIPVLKRRTSAEPLTIAPSKSSTTIGQLENGKSSGTVGRRASFENLQELDEDAALEVAMRESKELYEKDQKRRSSSLAPAKTIVEPSAVYPNFLDNVSKASLARSNSL